MGQGLAVSWHCVLASDRTHTRCWQRPAQPRTPLQASAWHIQVHVQADDTTIEQAKHAQACYILGTNIAPSEFDVWNHKYMLKVVSHTPPEIEAMAALHQAGQFIDIVREAAPAPEKLASWWSYRAQDFRKSNRGLRLDHILLSPGLKDAAYRPGKPSSRIHDDVRERG